MYPEGTNQYGCPLLDQTGAAAVKNFVEVIARLSPELRDAFEQERAARQDELKAHAARLSCTA